MSFTYIGNPYTSPIPSLQRRRFEITEAYTAAQLKLGFHVYSPVVHCHSLAEKFNLPTNFEFWQAYNYAMLCKASSLHVLTLPGWEDSKGLNHRTKGEIPIAHMLSIDVKFILPEAIAHSTKEVGYEIDVEISN